jgi:[ribosomal protein S18]-alanine N-acetyltransferase
MNAVPDRSRRDVRTLVFDRMRVDDLDQVVAIEQSVYPQPWSRGNFIDSLLNDYEAWVARDASGSLVAYFLLMAVVDEAHLLNISVRGDAHGRGIGRHLLDRIVMLTRAKGLQSVLLEVRPSNTRALAVYLRYGFVQIGLRKAYYPVVDNLREDAVVMRLKL